MSIAATGFSAVGKLVAVAVLLFVFLASMAGVVYMSLHGEEIKVPEIVGKDFVESEKELAALGLKIKKRADRPSTEKMNTVLEQLPRPGDTVKSGQLILVVVSRQQLEGEEAPKSLIKDIEEDDSEKIEEMISDKPKKTRSNDDTEKKKAETTRDVITEAPANTKTEASNTAIGTPIGNTDKAPETTPSETKPRNEKPDPAPKPSVKPPAERSGSGETRSRTTDQ